MVFVIRSRFIPLNCEYFLLKDAWPPHPPFRLLESWVLRGISHFFLVHGGRNFQSWCPLVCCPGRAPVILPDFPSKPTQGSCQRPSQPLQHVKQTSTAWKEDVPTNKHPEWSLKRNAISISEDSRLRCGRASGLSAGQIVPAVSQSPAPTKFWHLKRTRLWEGNYNHILSQMTTWNSSKGCWLCPLEILKIKPSLFLRWSSGSLPFLFVISLLSFDSFCHSLSLHLSENIRFSLY
jgi:hypothetical protein